MGLLSIFNPRTWRRPASSALPEARTIPAAARPSAKLGAVSLSNGRGKVPAIFDPQVWRKLAQTDVTPSLGTPRTRRDERRRSITRRRTRHGLTVK